MHYPVIESMTTCTIRRLCQPDGRGSWWPLTVRVWREEPVVQNGYDNHDIRDLCANMNGESNLGTATAAERIAALPRVNAVEVKDENGAGIVLYTNWP